MSAYTNVFKLAKMESDVSILSCLMHFGTSVIIGYFPSCQHLHLFSRKKTLAALLGWKWSRSEDMVSVSDTRTSGLFHYTDCEFSQMTKQGNQINQKKMCVHPLILGVKGKTLEDLCTC